MPSKNRQSRTVPITLICCRTAPPKETNRVRDGATENQLSAMASTEKIFYVIRTITSLKYTGFLVSPLGRNVT